MLLLDEVMTHAHEIDVNIDQTSRRLRLQNLRVLMAVIGAGSMGRARRELSITQPAISRSIAELEDIFGVPLLERGPHGVQPTAFGVALRDCGIAVFDDLRQGIKEIASLADPEAGEVLIGSGGFMAASFVAAVINRLSCRYPRMTFHLVAAPPETLQAELVRRISTW
jgi:DNA-binding transcriptional LysR family regulator